MVHFLMTVLYSNTNALSSTYTMQNISKRVPDVKVMGWLLTNFLVDIGDLSLRANWALINPRSFHLSSRILEKAIIRNRNSTVAMLSPFLTPTLKSMDVSIFPMMILTKLLLYMRLIPEHSLGGDAIFSQNYYE